ncbi:recombinase family protein [Saccharomonospora saliphila]|uniref:recombinase family protein n=1 Tax=Saccharomonospora saliphila TaxID=369829 RepID=UPI000A0689CC|nr:recombinase family protein [Saccharomonospora saliphila]
MHPRLRGKLSGESAGRPELAACLDYLRHGDTLVVLELARPGRSRADRAETGRVIAARILPGARARSFCRKNLPRPCREAVCSRDVWVAVPNGGRSGRT